MTDRQTDGQTDARGKTICLPTLSGVDIITSHNTIIQVSFVCLFLFVCPHTPSRCLGAYLHRTWWDPVVSLGDLILKGQCHLGHRSNFCFSEVVGFDLDKSWRVYGF